MSTLPKLDLTHAPDIPRPIRPLDIDQWRAAVSDDRTLMVFGGPGTGKTRTLLARILRLLQTGEEPDTISAFTFSERAARQMKQDIAEEVETQHLFADPDGVFAGTPFSFCLEFLRRLGCPSLKLSPHFALWDQDRCAGVIERLSHQPDVRDKPIQPGELRQLMQWHTRNRHRDDQPQIPASHGSWHRLVSAFGEEKKRQHALDFDDVIELTTRALQSDPDLCKEISAGRTKHVLIDDFQECTPIQYRLISLLIGDSGTTTVATDPNQAIHSTRGADTHMLVRFSDRYRPKKVFLRLNHRAGGELVHLAVALQESAERRGLHPDHQRPVRRESGHAPQLVIHDGPVGESDQWVVDLIKFLHNHDGYELEDIGILYPDHARGSRVAERLAAQGVKYQVLDQCLISGEPDFKAITSILGVVAHPSDQSTFYRAATAGLHAGPVDRFRSLMPEIENIAERNNCDLPSAAAIHLATVNRPTVISRRLQHIVHMTSVLHHLLTTQDVTIALMVRVACTEFYRTTGSAPPLVLLPTLYRLIAAAENFAGKSGGSARHRLVRFLDHLSVATDPAQRTPVTDPLFHTPRGVTLGTIKSSQGRQWQAVVLMECTDEVIPRALGDGDIDESEESLRIFYVGVTRARDRLYVVCPLVDDAYHLHHPSRFVSLIERSLQRRGIDLETSHEVNSV